MLPLPPDEEDVGVREDLEMVRYRRLRKIEPLAHLAARKLARRGDLLDHPEAAPVRQGLEHPHDSVVVDDGVLPGTDIDVFRIVDPVKVREVQKNAVGCATRPCPFK